MDAHNLLAPSSFKNKTKKHRLKVRESWNMLIMRYLEMEDYFLIFWQKKGYPEIQSSSDCVACKSGRGEGGPCRKSNVGYEMYTV